MAYKPTVSVGLSTLLLLYAARAQATPDDARAAARCLERYATSPQAVIEKQGTLAEGHVRLSLRCMPARFRDLPVPAPEGARRVAACFTRLALERAAATARIEEACRARASSFDLHGADEALSTGRFVDAAPGVSVHVPAAQPDRISVGESAVSEAVAARGEALAACRGGQGAGTLLLHVRAGLDTANVLLLERDDGASETLGRCVEAVAATARVSSRYRYLKPGELWSGLVEIRLRAPSTRS